MVLGTLCMLGWENGIIYVNMGYIFLTLLGPVWDVRVAIGKDSRGARPICGFLTLALSIHKLQDFGRKADSGHRSCVTENSSIKKPIFLLSKQMGLPGLHSDWMSPVLLYFVTVRGLLAQTGSWESSRLHYMG